MLLDDSSGLLWDTPKRAARGHSDTNAQIAARIAAMHWDYSNYCQPELREPLPGCIALDFETEDPTINTKGPCWAFPGIGQIIGMAVAWEGFEAYYPIGHREGNVDSTRVLEWLAYYFKREQYKWICANATYDIGWARREIGIYPAGGVEDVQFMAALLDEYRMSYSLESISRSYLKRGKKTDVIEEIEKKLSLKHSQVMGNLRQMPGPVLAPYAAEDAGLTRDVRALLMREIDAQGLRVVHELESGLIPMSVEMRRKGMRVDVDRAAQLSAEISGTRIPALQDEVNRLCGVHVEPWEATTVEAAFATFGYKCGRTKNGSPEVNAAVLGELAKTQPIAANVLRMRKMSKVQSTFLDGHILYYQTNGRVHAEFNQLRSERDEGGNYGAVTGRFSVSNPGMQQIPVRDPEWGPIVRSMFLADENEIVASIDYSSQEPRLAVHFAFQAYLLSKTSTDPHVYKWQNRLASAAIAVDQYKQNSNTDYHQFVADLCGIPRPPAKTINLGLGYGMGGAKLARSLGLPTQWMELIPTGGRTFWKEISEHEIPAAKSRGHQCVEVAGKEAKAIIKKWENGVPFMRGLFDMVGERAEQRGYITTLLKRRCRFPMGGDGRYDWIHKALNRLCQSSAADQTKKGMLDLWRAGICPLLTVHDELVFSVRNKEQAMEYARYMEDAVTLVLPSVVDIKVGLTWGDIPK